MRVFLIVIDSFGIGSAPDAAGYGDEGANTAGHIVDQWGAGKWPTLAKFGLGVAMENIRSGSNPWRGLKTLECKVAGLVPASAGKDTVSGHWELCGIELESPFRVFPEKESFPAELLKGFCETFQCGVLGNEAASGTEIIARLGQKHVETGNPILYTSADSVIQIAAHESIIPLKRLYEMCHYMRVEADKWNVGRVIARPFVGTEGSFERTSGRKDLAMKPPQPNLLTQLQDRGIETIGIGKIGDIFSGCALDATFHDKGNEACMRRMQELWDQPTQRNQFVFVNLVDTDMIYGHRRDVSGYGNAVSQIDLVLKEMMDSCTDDSHLIISADHGCDPSWKGSDHTRECVPFLHWSRNTKGENLGKQRGFRFCADDILATFS